MGQRHPGPQHQGGVRPIRRRAIFHNVPFREHELVSHHPARPRCAAQQNRSANDRFGSKARITAPQHCCPLHLNKQTPTGRVQCDAMGHSRHMQCSKGTRYSISSSARTRSVSGIVRPIAFAVLRLITSSNLVGRWIGSSPGFAPARIRATYAAACVKIDGKFGP